MKVVVAHNRYREAQPSGENSSSTPRSPSSRAAGVEVLPFLRSSDEIARCRRRQKALLPLSPIYARRGPARPAPAARASTGRTCCTCTTRTRCSRPGWCGPRTRTACRWCRPCTTTGRSARPGSTSATGTICTDCRGRAFGLPAIVHRCYRGSAAQSALMATTLAVHRRHLALGGPVHRADRRDRRRTCATTASRPTGSRSSRTRVPDPGAPAPLGDGFLFAGRLSPEKGLDLLLDAWRRHPDGALGPLRIAGDGAAARRWPRRPPPSASDVTYLGPLDRAGVRAALRRRAVVIAASTWHDVLPTVIIEALASRPAGARHRAGRHPVPGRRRRPARARRHRPGRRRLGRRRGERAGRCRPAIGPARPAGWCRRSRPRWPPPCRWPGPAPPRWPRPPAPGTSAPSTPTWSPSAHRHLRRPDPHPHPHLIHPRRSGRPGNRRGPPAGEPRRTGSAVRSGGVARRVPGGPIRPGRPLGRPPGLGATARSRRPRSGSARRGRRGDADRPGPPA